VDKLKPAALVAVICSRQMLLDTLALGAVPKMSSCPLLCSAVLTQLQGESGLACRRLLEPPALAASTTAL
jgi:hypothetical protein